MAAALSGIGKVGSALLKGAKYIPRLARASGYKYLKGIPKGGLNKAKYFGKSAGKAGLATLAGLGNVYMANEMLDAAIPNELSEDQRNLLQQDMMSALSADSLGEDMYQQQLLQQQLRRMNQLNQRQTVTREGMQSQLKAAALQRMLEEHNELLMRNALTEQQLNQSRAFSPDYGELVNQIDRRYMR